MLSSPSFFFCLKPSSYQTSWATLEDLERSRTRSKSKFPSHHLTTFISLFCFQSSPNLHQCHSSLHIVHTVIVHHSSRELLRTRPARSLSDCLESLRRLSFVKSHPIVKDHEVHLSSPNVSNITKLQDFWQPLFRKISKKSRMTPCAAIYYILL